MRSIRRSLAAAAAFLVTAAAMAVNVSPASAHGVTMFPGSRTYLCYVDGKRENGQIIPYNPACADAVAQSGTTPLYNWYAVLDSNAGGRNVGYVPDGTICSAGNRSPYDFSPYNMARTDWPLTHLTSGAEIRWRHSNWAHHPGTFHMYVTRDSWDPTRPLAWSDLEAFWSVTDPPQSGSAGSEGGYYYWNAQLPSGKTGRHMIFIQWVRADSTENFFSCSDVVFDGGHGEVTGVGPDQGTQPPPSSPPPPTSPPPSTPPSSTPPADGCEVDYVVRGEWGAGFTTDVTVVNRGAPVSGWTLGFRFPAGQQVTSGWSATWSQTGDQVYARSLDWNANLATGGAATIGFNGSYAGSNPEPSQFTLNGVACTS
ncbi:MAG: lytic polysaccharide monooxygenase [Micromonosporaceae bacterium]